MGTARRAGFDLIAYQEMYPDVGALHPLVHYAASGQFEGRLVNSATRAALPPSQHSPLLSALTFYAPSDPSGHAPVGDRVDIITPFYNRRKSIVAAVRSALEQTVDVTVYAIDDGSTDGGAELLEETFTAAISAGQLTILRQENKGAAAARNAGLAAGKGDWIAYVDSDNILDPDHVEKLLAATRNAGAAMAYGGWRTETGAVHAAQPYKRFALLRANYIDLNTLIHHRRLYDQLGGFDVRLRRLQDWDLVLRYGRLTAPAVSSQLSVVRDVGPRSISATVDIAPAFRQVRQNHICELIAAGLGPRMIFGTEEALGEEADGLRSAGLAVESGVLSDAVERYRRGTPDLLHLLTRDEAIAAIDEATPYFRLVSGGSGSLSASALNIAAADAGPAGWTMDPDPKPVPGLANSHNIT